MPKMSRFVSKDAPGSAGVPAGAAFLMGSEKRYMSAEAIPHNGTSVPIHTSERI